MQFDTTNQFKKAYRKLSRSDKRHVDEAIERFSNNPLNPSLAIEKVTNQGSVWSFRGSLRIRCTFEWEGNLEELRNAERVLLRNLGGHEIFR